MARRTEEHHYADCQDPDCPRFPCRVYKEGVQAGYWRGYCDGEAAGFAAGYATGAASAAPAAG
jgi:hypothetical protein